MKTVKIKSIKRIDSDSMRYDIETKKTHNFFADGILVHNSCINLHYDWHKDEWFAATTGTAEGEGEINNREHTLVENLEFNDKNDMKVTVQVALDYNLSPNEVNLIHSRINDVLIKIKTSLSAAAKIVVPQFGAVELNKHERSTAEAMLDSLLSKELPEFYVEYKRVRITDVNIPDGISKLAEATAVQVGKNELAQKMEAEQVSLAKAKVAEAQGNYDAGMLNAKTKDLMSAPKMIELMRVENDKIKWEGYLKHGTSPYGTGNVYGSETAILKGLK